MGFEPCPPYPSVCLSQNLFFVWTSRPPIPLEIPVFLQSSTMIKYLPLDALGVKGGSRILKWGLNFCNNVREIKYYFNIQGIRKKRKKEAQKKGGENSPISPPLDPPLGVSYRIPWKNRNVVWKLCQWDDWWHRTLNQYLYQVYK